MCQYKSSSGLKLKQQEKHRSSQLVYNFEEFYKNMGVIHSSRTRTKARKDQRSLLPLIN